MDLDGLLDVARRAAHAGGEILVQHFGALRDVRAKAPGDWVSEADLASELAVRTMLERESGLPVHGEEEGGARADIEWLVDPLDGTANFVHGFDAVGVSIGLVDHGQPVVGVVHAPFLANGDSVGRTYTATRGGGAHRDGTPIRVSTRRPSEAIVATGFPFRNKQLLPEYLESFLPALGVFEDVRRVGAASLDLCWAAEGVFDGYFELRLGPWDVAAGALIVREAGGVVTDWAGDPDAWLPSGNIVAGAPDIHAALLAVTHNRGEP
ncbi:MAG: inositol monophosphatase family protein [Actinomycetota bacterium]|nr:inositol monophosphatase family protein [Actinomycetota bacterium]